MTFNQIALKIFKSNFKRYIFYFLCNSFAIMVFFMFTTLLFNEGLHPSAENGLSEAIMIPTVALIIFAFFFINYAHSIFIKGRKKEFGLLMNLGMSHRDIRNMTLVENGIIAVASLCLGITAGTIFSRLFFIMIMRLIDVNGVSFELSIKSYLYSIGVFSVIFTSAVVVTMIVTYTFEIAKLLKEDRISQRNKIASPLIGGIGFVILLTTLLILYTNFGVVPNNDGKLLLYCTISILISLYITFSQLGSFFLKVTKRKSSIYYRNLLLLTNVDYKFKQVKKIVFLITVMVMVTIFYSGFVLHLFLTAEKVATENNPYDIAFVQTENKNDIPIDEVFSLFETKENPITEHKTIEVMNFFHPLNYNNRTIFIADNQLASVTNNHVQVEKGKYRILVQQPFLSEQVKNRMIEDIQDNLHNRGMNFSFKLQDSMFKRLINDLKYMDNSLIVLNSTDFQQLKSSTLEIQLAKIQLFNVTDWKNSKDIINELQEKLIAYNETTSGFDVMLYGRSIPEREFFQVGSKISQYNYNKQGGGLILYLVTFIGVLFFIATVIILVLILFSELEEEQRKYKKLYRIGITEKEIHKIIAGELKILFFVAPIIGIGISFVYTSTFFKHSGMYIEAYSSSLAISCFYLFFQCFYYFIAKRKYVNQIIESLK